MGRDSFAEGVVDGGEGGDDSGFGAQNQFAERGFAETGGVRGGKLGVGPPAFGADSEDGLLAARPGGFDEGTERQAVRRAGSLRDRWRVRRRLPRAATRFVAQVRGRGAIAARLRREFSSNARRASLPRRASLFRCAQRREARWCSRRVRWLFRWPTRRRRISRWREAASDR